MKKDGEHQWWDTLFRWSLTAVEIFSRLFHPLVLLILNTLIIVRYVKACVMIYQLHITSVWMKMEGVQETDKELSYRDTPKNWLSAGVMEALSLKCNCSHGANNVGMRLKTMRYAGRYSVKGFCGWDSHLMGAIGHQAETGPLLLLDDLQSAAEEGVTLVVLFHFS